MVRRKRNGVMTYCFQLDGTICTEEEFFPDAKPYLYMIDHINKLYEQGHVIKIYSTRSKAGGKDWSNYNKIWLKDWEVKYHELINEGIPDCDRLISTNAQNTQALRNELVPQPPPEQRTGFVCSCFDLLHAGHFIMLKDARSKCDKLIAGLQTDPTIDRPEKNKPIQSLEERRESLSACKYVDEIRLYDTEKSLIELLLTVKPDIRVLGTDWEGKEYTGKGIAKEEYFHDRSTHSYSSSNLRKRIYEKEKEKNEN